MLGSEMWQEGGTVLFVSHKCPQSAMNEEMVIDTGQMVMVLNAWAVDHNFVQRMSS